jgi:hypothetical protein
MSSSLGYSKLYRLGGLKCRLRVHILKLRLSNKVKIIELNASLNGVMSNFVLNITLGINLFIIILYLLEKYQKEYKNSLRVSILDAFKELSD